MKLCLQINTEKNIRQKATLGTQNDLRPVVATDKYKGVELLQPLRYESANTYPD